MVPRGSLNRVAARCCTLGPPPAERLVTLVRRSTGHEGRFVAGRTAPATLAALPIRSAYFFSPPVTVSVRDSLMAPGALMMDMKLLLPIMLRSGKLMAMRNRA